MQDRIYTDLLKGDKPIGALAVEYSVSKGRIEAIKKLKEVEAEMRRQVSAVLSHSHRKQHFSDDPNRLVLKTSTWLQTSNAWLSDLSSSISASVSDTNQILQANLP